ncbi:MAG: serine hydrolase [Acidovorax sp.]|uniref:serine hydrolase domain-containing protein n=1 Tax=Acidovorax sp. TaxID=1872122 RepID=UPI0022BE2AFB|nr:serine hydrolase domain-containing protein [Acidovorax sp.]MCZ8220558.1 serine hydrolase [Acidovorax sp.]
MRPLTRRHLLLAGVAASPLLVSCATDLSRYQGQPVADVAARLGVCAAALATLRAGQVLPTEVVGSCGAAPDAVFQAASLTKPVVAYGALRLVLAGRLDLQAPVSHYLPQGYVHYQHVLRRAPGDARDTVPASTLARIPVASLLNHTSGLPNWTSGALAPGFDPGQRWRYSGEGYVLLQTVMEAITGVPIAPWMEAQVFAPLGMRDSSLAWKSAYEGRAVHAHGGASGVTWNQPVAAASLYTTAGDFARLLAAFVSDEQLLALALSAPVAADKALGLEWGYGWGIEHTQAGPLLWQWGNNPGFRNFAMVSPTTRDGFVLLTNSDRGMALAAPLAQRVLPGEHPVFQSPWLG